MRRLSTTDDREGMKRSFTFRCVRCERTTYVVAVWEEVHAPAGVRCSNCGHRYQLHPSRPRQRSDLAYYMYVKRYAEKMRLDMATAYSVAEGIMSEERATSFRGRPVRKKPKARSRWTLWALVAALVAAAGAGGEAVLSWNRSTPPGARTQASIVPASVRSPAAARAVPTQPSRSARAIGAPSTARFTECRYDDNGDPVQISGPDPSSVLLSFCRAGRGAWLREPVGLVAAPRDNETRLGLYRDLGDLTSRPAIRIYRDPRTGRWSSGDGRGPITGVDTGDLPYGTTVVPVGSSSVR